MPELPEVETTVRGLTQTVVGLTIQDIWTDLARTTITRPDYKETIKYFPFFEHIRDTICGARIISAERRAKNILINLSNDTTILIHMKMTGHLMYGKYAHNLKTNTWTPANEEKNEALRDPYNRFVHVVFSLNNGKHLVFCDARKFGKVTLLPTKTAHQTKHLDKIGPEPLDEAFTVEQFIKRMQSKPRGKIKQVLMDQSIIAGVGNIYSDEALWLAGIHPNSTVSAIPTPDLKKLYRAVQDVLAKGIDFGGDSTSDYRQIDGKRGQFSHTHNAYRLTGKPCMKHGCKGVILRMIVGGRSAHFCQVHQKLFI